MKRQRARKAAIYVSFLLFPATIYYFSPFLIIQGTAEGILTGSFIAFGLMFAISFALGRAFCGWACPAAGLQEACFRVNDRRAKGGRGDMVKFAIWVPWIVVIALVAVSSGGYHSIEPLYMTTSGISVYDFQGVMIFLVFTGVITALALTLGRRSFCHYACWMAPFMILGSGLGNRLHLRTLHLESDKSKCTNCLKCTKNCPMSLDVNKMVQSGSVRNRECVLCGTCVDGCSFGAIRYSF